MKDKEPQKLETLQMLHILGHNDTQFNFEKDFVEGKGRSKLYRSNKQNSDLVEIQAINQYGPYYFLDMRVLTNEGVKPSMILMEETDLEELRKFAGQPEELANLWNVPNSEHWPTQHMGSFVECLIGIIMSFKEPCVNSENMSEPSVARFYVQVYTKNDEIEISGQWCGMNGECTFSVPDKPFQSPLPYKWFVSIRPSVRLTYTALYSQVDGGYEDNEGLEDLYTIQANQEWPMPDFIQFDEDEEQIAWIVKQDGQQILKVILKKTV